MCGGCSEDAKSTRSASANSAIWCLVLVVPLVSKEPLSQFEELKSKMHPLFVLLLFLNKVHKSAMMVEK